MTPGSRPAPAGSHWSDVAQAYAASFAGLSAGTVPTLLEDLAPQGRRLLDVGCGTGHLAVSAADRGGDVTTVEQDPAMLGLAKARLPREVRSLEAALPDLPFPDGAFDRVVANFVVNHLGDPRAGIRELARVCAPDGLVAVTGWTNAPTVRGLLFRRVVEDSGAVPPEGLQLPPELDYERSVAGLRGLLEQAGLAVERATELRWQWRVSPRALWSGIAGGVSTLGATYLAQSPAVRDRMREVFFAHAEELSEEGTLVLPSVAAYALGRRRPATPAAERPEDRHG